MTCGTTEGPSPRQGNGPVEMSFPGGNDLQANTPSQGPAQAEFSRDPRAGRAPHLRLVPPPRRRRIDVRISASAGRFPIGRTRPLKLTESDLAWLLEAAQRLERRR
jgi:hypothetical protein